MEGLLLSGRYKLLEKIGQGGFATVWRAQDELLERQVAVKLMDPRLLEWDGEVAVRQFMREAKTVAALRHPNIIHVYDMGQEGSHLFLVMELMADDLAARLAAHGPYTLPEALAVLAPAAAALDAAHATGLVHRDVKPQNILFDPNGRIALTDFGLVKSLSGTSYASRTIYSSNRTLGTPEYMAPEQAEGREVDGRTDLYALAVILFQLLTGELPFKGETPLSILYQTVNKPRQELAGRLPANLPPAAADLLLAALAVVPDERPGRAGEWVAKLQAARQVLPPPPKPQPEPQPEQKRKPHPRSKPKTVPQPAQEITLPHIIKGAPPLHFEWCYVPAGPFIMGEGNEKRTVTLPDYWMARYPVTNAQYAHFVKAGGYRHKKWWLAGWQWRENGGVTQPAYWTDKKWNAPELPVVGVSWYEAVAFCQWAAEATGEAIQLPPETMWEKAARGTDGRDYPWGNEWEANHCNTGEKGPGQTTSVGHYSPAGDSPYGCADMSGTVWEWCLNKYDDSNDETVDDTNARRVVRGGSWFSNSNFARAACRGNLTPDNRYHDFGFRVVLVRRSPISS